MREYFYLMYLFIFIVSASLAADTKSIKVNLGGVDINIKAPKGFYEVSTLSPQTHRLVESFTPVNTRLLAVFVSENDLGRILKGEDPLLKQRLSVKILHNAENINMSTQKFKEITSANYDYFNDLLQKIMPNIKTNTENHVEAYFSNKLNIKAQVKLGEMIPLDVSNNKPNRFTATMITRVQYSVAGVQDSYVKVSSNSYILLKGKMLLLEVYNHFDTEDDINWVKQKNKEWVDLLLSGSS